MATEKKPRSGAKRACVCCCGTGCGLLLTFLASIAVLMFVPAIRNALVIFSQSHKLGKVMLLTDTAGALGAMVDKSQSTLEVSNMRMLGAEQNVGVYGVEGVKRGWAFKTDVFGVNRDGVVPQSMSDRTWRELAYDPKLRRHEDLIIVANTSAIPKDERQKAFPGVFPSVIQRSTDDPERVARRLLYVESFPALQENPPAGSVAEFSVPKHVTKDTPQSDGVLDTIVYNVVRQLWGTETDWDMEEVKSIRSHTLESVGKTFLHGDGALAKTLRLFLGDPVVQLHAFREVQAKFEKEKLFPCPAGKAFLEKAKARGLVGEERLREFLAVTIFAGMVGTPQLADNILNVIKSDPKKYLPMYHSDPEAFVLEAARLSPSVGGMMVLAHKDEEITMASGSKQKIYENEIFFGVIAGANLDPLVWGGPNNDPEYAKQFVMGRKNGNALMNWVNALDDIRKCDPKTSSAGCPNAPRPCPGVWLAFRLVKDTVAHFTKYIEIPTNKPEL